MVIQRFVKSRGSKAFICRTFWKRDEPPFCWIINNKEEYASTKNVPEVQKYCTSSAKLHHSVIVKNKSGYYLKETLQYLDNCVKYIQKKIPVKFIEFVGDFIKDENNIWWLINVKGFVLEDNQAFNNERFIHFFFFIYVKLI